MTCSQLLIVSGRVLVGLLLGIGGTLVATGRPRAVAIVPAALSRVPEFTIHSDQIIARKWQSLTPTQPAAHAITRTSIKTATQDLPEFQWQAIYSGVGGKLPLSEVPHMHSRYGLKPTDLGASFLRTSLEVLQPGKAKLVIEPPTGLSVWIDQTPYDPAAAPTIDWAVGLQKITIAINRDVAGNAPLSLRVEAPAEKGALIKSVGGK